MKNVKKETLETVSQKVNKKQVLDKLKKLNIKGGTGCPPPVGVEI